MFRDVEEDLPALEINLDLSTQVPESLRKRTARKDSLGPVIVKQNNVSAVAFDTPTTRVYVGMDHGDIFYWDIRSRRGGTGYSSCSPHRYVGQHKGNVSAICALDAPHSAPMPLVATGSADRTIKLWDPKKGNLVEPALLLQTLYEHGGTVTSIARFDNFLISTATDCTVRLWKSVEGRQQLLYPAYEMVRPGSDLLTYIFYAECDRFVEAEAHRFSQISLTL